MDRHFEQGRSWRKPSSSRSRLPQGKTPKLGHSQVAGGAGQARSKWHPDVFRNRKRF